MQALIRAASGCAVSVSADRCFAVAAVEKSTTVGFETAAAFSDIEALPSDQLKLP